MNWKQQIEAQIEDLREEAINYGGGRAYGQHLDDTADTMQALLDVAVAADAWRQSDDPGHSSACSEDSFCEVSYAYCEACELRDALDKLREVSDG